MKFVKNTDDLSFGFEAHPTGWYAFQVLEGVELYKSEKNQSQSLMVPLQSTKALKPKEGTPGDADGVGGKLTHFINIITGEGVENKVAEKNINSLLSITDLIDKFASKFDDVEITDDRFVEQMKLSLPGKFLKAEIEHRKNKQTGDTNAQIKTWGMFKKQTPKVAEVVEDSGDDEGWD